MKTSHFLTFTSLVLLEVVLCVSFFFIYSGGLQKTYIEGLREYSKNIAVEFKTGRFFVDSSDDVEAMEMMDKRLVWIQSTYRGNPLLMFHIYRSMNNNVIFSYARNEQIDRLKSEYIRQWKPSMFRKTDFALVTFGKYNIISIRNEIDDDVRPVGKLELVFDYNPVIVEIEKLKFTLIWFSSLVAVFLFVAFLMVSILWKKRDGKSKNNATTQQKNMDAGNTTETNKKTTTIGNDIKEKVLYDDKKNPHKIKTLHLERTNKLIRKDVENDKNNHEETRTKEKNLTQKKKTQFNFDVDPKRGENKNDSDFLSDTKNKERSYIHKIRI